MNIHLQVQFQEKLLIYILIECIIIILPHLNNSKLSTYIINLSSKYLIIINYGFDYFINLFDICIN